MYTPCVIFQLGMDMRLYYVIGFEFGTVEICIDWNSPLPSPWAQPRLTWPPIRSQLPMERKQTPTTCCRHQHHSESRPWPANIPTWLEPTKLYRTDGKCTSRWVLHRAMDIRGCTSMWHIQTCVQEFKQNFGTNLLWILAMSDYL